MIDAILGLLGFDGPGALLALLAGAAAVVGGAWWRGRSGARREHEADAARDYREKRKEIDDADLGLGASDRERIGRLHDIADRHGSGRD